MEIFAVGLLIAVVFDLFHDIDFPVFTSIYLVIAGTIALISVV